MAAEDSEASANRSRGFFEPFRTFLATFVGLIHTRLDLISTELEEERERLKEIVLLGAISFFCLSLGIVLLTLFFVVIFLDTYAFYVLGGFVLLYLGLGVIVGLIAR